jgi:hypothetical protein
MVLATTTHILFGMRQGDFRISTHLFMGTGIYHAARRAAQNQRQAARRAQVDPGVADHWEK